MSDEFAQFKQTYITECHELLGDMEELLLGLDVASPEDDTLHAIFRCAHSIKGGAGAFGLNRIVSFTHVAEFLLDSLREHQITLTEEVVDALLRSVDVMNQLVQSAENDEAPPESLGKDLELELAKFAEMEVKEGVAESANAMVQSDEVVLYQIGFTPKPHLFSSGNEPFLLIRELSELGDCTAVIQCDALPDLEDMDPEHCYVSWVIDLETDKGEEAIKEVFEFVEDECDLEIQALGAFSLPGAIEEEVVAVAAAVEEAVEVAAAVEETVAVKKAGGGTIRVDLEKIDRLVNLVGEVVITQSMLSAQSAGLSMDRYPQLIQGVEELSQHARELQEAVMSVRMQPVKSVFSRMPRIVRDLSTKLGKKIRLDMSGEGTEVDKTVVELLGDPLTHMIRNSIDHGIEMPKVRLDNNKPEEGVIQLSASHRGGRIIIEIVDDGAGINRERVRNIAIERKLIQPTDELQNHEIDQLIFEPGFSTAEEVTDISGRGVGMDVVRRNIESLGGTVHIKSEPGMGSRFIVSLPLTLAILDGMIVRCGKEHYIIPIANIIETMRPKEEDVRRIADGNDLINVRGEFISIIYLSRLFAISNAIADASKALVVLVESGQEVFGLVVDELIGQQQVVIKSLEANADPVPGISGATILGDGHVSLILDAAQLNSMAQQKIPNERIHALKDVTQAESSDMAITSGEDETVGS